MNRLYLCFTCARDYCLMGKHYSIIRKCDPDATVVYAIDKEDEIPRKIPRGAVIIRTDFARRGNLNGAECVRGMLMTMGELYERYHYDRLVKIDADTACLMTDWTGIGQFVGYHSSNGYYCSGCCYSLTINAIWRMLDYVFRHDLGDDDYVMPEDATMTMIAAASGNQVEILDGKAGCVPFLASCWSRDNLGINGLRVIHLG